MTDYDGISSFICYRTGQYKLHYFETPTNIKFVMLTDTKAPSMRIALQQIYVNLYVEYGRWQVEQVGNKKCGTDSIHLAPSRQKSSLPGRASRWGGCQQ